MPELRKWYSHRRQGHQQLDKMNSLIVLARLRFGKVDVLTGGLNLCGGGR
jgi:hypothetical protein